MRPTRSDSAAAIRRGARCSTSPVPRLPQGRTDPCSTELRSHPRRGAMPLLAPPHEALRPAPPKSPPPRVAGLFARLPRRRLVARRPGRAAPQLPLVGLRRGQRHRPGSRAAAAVPLPQHRPGRARADRRCRTRTRSAGCSTDPNPWLTPWELWYLTVVYLELTGNCFWYVAPQSVGDTRLGTPGEIWIIPTPWVRVVPDAHAST